MRRKLQEVREENWPLLALLLFAALFGLVAALL